MRGFFVFLKICFVHFAVTATWFLPLVWARIGNPYGPIRPYTRGKNQVEQSFQKKEEENSRIGVKLFSLIAQILLEG